MALKIIKEKNKYWQETYQCYMTDNKYIKSEIECRSVYMFYTHELATLSLKVDLNHRKVLQTKDIL